MFATPAAPRHVLPLLLALPLSLQPSCTPLDAPATGATGPAPIMIAQDASGRAVPLHALPAWPHLIWEGVAAEDALPLYLFDGPLDEALAQDLTSLPLLRASKDRLLPTELSPSDLGVRLSPLLALNPRHLYCVALMPLPGVSDRPVVYEVRVDERERAGASLLATLPAALQQDVPFSAQHITAAFDGQLASCAGLTLSGEGTRLSGRATSASCAGFGAEAVDCCELALDTPLKADQSYTLLGSVRDSHGGPAQMAPVTFSTGQLETAPLTLAPLTCQPHEQAQGDGLCTQVDDSSIDVRLRFNAPARVTAILEMADAEGYADGLAAGGELSLHFDNLPADQALTLNLRASAAAGEPLVHSQALRTLPPLPTLTISEVRSDPLGTEPTQEYVELWNFGPTPLPLGGLTLTDDPTISGQALPADAVLAPNARALLVPQGFDPKAPQEPVPSGVRLLHGPQALVRNGLANRGEALLLRDGQGHILGAAPGQRTGPGACLVRRQGAPPRSGRPDDFSVGTCNPGE